MCRALSAVCFLAMKSLAVIVSGGSANNFIQVMTILMAAVHSDIKVRVLFRDESVYRLTPDTINKMDLSPIHAANADTVTAQMKKLDLTDMHKLCQDIKASGDVKYYACSSSMALCGMDKEGLIAEIDEVRGLPAFLLEDVAQAEKVLTF